MTQQPFDSHPGLPLDPDTDQQRAVRPVHTPPSHIAIVAIGGFFGTLARYEIGLLIPAKDGEWPFATFLINMTGSFILGFLLESLVSRGKDVGGRRALRLLIGTGFCGAFTTYSSLAAGAVLLIQDHRTLLSISYVGTTLVLGTTLADLGIQVASKYNPGRRVKT